MLFAANIAVEKEVITAVITIALLISLLYLHIYTLRMYTNTARSIEAEQRLCSEALTSEVGLLQNFRAYKKWIPSHIIFE